MRVLLVNPQFSRTTTDAPLGLAYVAATATKAGCDVKVVDADADKSSLTDDDVRRMSEAFGPDLIGVSIYTDFARKAYSVIDMLAPLGAPIVVGGPHPSSVPDEPFEYGADFVVRGEGERAFSELLSAMRSRRRLEAIRGLSYRSGGTVVHNEPMTLISDLDQGLPLPAKELFDREQYSGRMGAEPFGGILTSRGCPSRCVYCSNRVMGRSYRFRKATRVVAEIGVLRERYGIERFTFADDTFTADKRRLEQACRLILEQHPDIGWSCFSRVSAVTPGLLELMKQSGCFLINFGIEHGDNDSLKRLKKGISLKTIGNALRWTKDAGIGYHTNYIYGFPWETEESIEKTLRHSVDFVDLGFQSSPVVPYPGTELYETYKHDYGLEKWWLRRDGIRWQDTMKIGRGGSLREVLFFRLDSNKETLIERALQKNFSYHMKFKKHSGRANLRGLTYHLLHACYRISPRLERTVGAALSRGKRLLATQR
jgi:radical SAM superfamily enzyme YgiQ (UPF0313 family)